MARISYVDRKNMEDRIRDNMRKFFFTKVGIDEFIENASMNFLSYMDNMLTDELHRRDVNKKASLLKHAGFPSLKNIDDYNWTEVKLPGSLPTKEELLSLEFLEKKVKDNLILYGVCGSGLKRVAAPNDKEMSVK